MTAKILAIDPRWRQPARVAFMHEYLPEGYFRRLRALESFSVGKCR
jgi:hypothetical protein